MDNRYVHLEQIGMAFDTKKGRFVALQNVNLDIAQGEFISLIGHSGCGKSTVLNVIAGLLTPTSGVALAAGREIDGPGPERAVVFQNHSLLPWLSCFDNVYLGVERVFGKTEKKDQLKSRTAAALELVSLGHAAHKRPGEISGGMQKRVAIARAIVLNPKYLFCDEPNSGLDPHTSLVIDQLLSSITKEYNITTIINTHDMNSVMGIGENILFIYQGNNEWQGTKNDVMGATNEKLNDLVFASDLFKRVKEVEMNKHKQL
jgi:ABC-type nitrate/sulfonate/bicarbonate transport system ATPase subunit